MMAFQGASAPDENSEHEYIEEEQTELAARLEHCQIKVGQGIAVFDRKI